jgi:hypothetical protein
VSDDTEHRKLNAIVGAAIKALAASGVEDEVVGAFAASHRSQVAKILGQPETPAAAPDLLDMITAAVRAAMTEAGISSRKVPAGPTTKRMNVLVQGRRTSVTLAHGVFERVASANGGAANARQLVQAIATEAPSSVENRSGWIEERLLALLSSQAVAPALPRH